MNIHVFHSHDGSKSMKKLHLLNNWKSKLDRALKRAQDALNYYLSSSYFCRLLITFANSLNPDQDRQEVGPDLDPNWLTLLIVFCNLFFVC